AGAFFASKMGKELKDDPEYQKRLAEGVFDNGKQTEIKDSTPAAKRSVLIFVLGVVAVVVLGSIPSLMPSWTVNGQTVTLRMTELIEIGMLCTAALIVILCKAKVDLIGKSSVFSAGMQAVIAIFGIAWMGDTFIAANLEFLKNGLVDIVQQYPYSFALILFVMSILLYSQAATVKALLPLGISLGLPAASLIAMYPAVNGYFFIPNYPTLVAAINFDATGTTRIGKYVLNHSFMIPGLVSTAVAIAAGFLIASVVM
ncbi:MAG: anaerobic C4-dicarboxylate transporter family protein, partial [Tannerellaceae bacterium]